MKEKSPRVCRAADADSVNQPTRLRLTAIEGPATTALVDRRYSSPRGSTPGTRRWGPQVMPRPAYDQARKSRGWEDLANVGK